MSKLLIVFGSFLIGWAIPEFLMIISHQPVKKPLSVNIISAFGFSFIISGFLYL